MNTVLDATLNRLLTQFGMDSLPYCGGKLRWAITCRSTPVCTLVRVKEKTSGIHKTVLTMHPHRVGFLATLAFVDVMKKVLQDAFPQDIVAQKSSKMENNPSQKR